MDLKCLFKFVYSEKTYLQTAESDRSQNCLIKLASKPTAKPQQNILDPKQFMDEVHIRSKEAPVRSQNFKECRTEWIFSWC